MGENIDATEPVKRREHPVGILRLDFGKPRRLSAEFKFLQREPASPQPSVDRLSVTFADGSVRSDSSVRCNYFNPVLEIMDNTINNPPSADADDSDQEDYSASVNAIIQRRASTRRSRRRSRRSSSPFSPDYLPESQNGRRASSVFTTSSGDTAITIDENLPAAVTQEEIFENIKLHKEVLSSVKMQPWNMRKKLKLVIQAKAYIKKHEGVLQERLAQSHSTRDMLARWNIVLVQKWQHCRREMTNLSMWFIPWELKIKEIESHFGSVVASYFIFLRWLFWVNVVISIVLISFVTIPELTVNKVFLAYLTYQTCCPTVKYSLYTELLENFLFLLVLLYISSSVTLRTFFTDLTNVAKFPPKYGEADRTNHRVECFVDKI
ncbi:hypothetical protein JTB14_013231 [Gonioctena quinquepunctata]|nr:hypothetical protein JTB14_013231 [Gonioctena quinquepunctata]